MQKQTVTQSLKIVRPSVHELRRISHLSFVRPSDFDLSSLDLRIYGKQVTVVMEKLCTKSVSKGEVHAQESRTDGRTELIFVNKKKTGPFFI